jgi:hypothetical protein
MDRVSDVLPMSPHMLDTYKDLIARQYEACFCMLGACVDRCSESAWHGPVANLRFCQAAFHALFCADLYLGEDVESLRGQLFHREHAAVFGDYEEFEDRPPQAVYEKPFIKAYLQHCRDKAATALAGETEETLVRRAGCDWLDLSRAELHVYNIRHIHHHAAQLSLRLRLDAGEGIPWVSSGWRAV